MGKSWVYRGLKGGEIPGIKTRRSVKLKRADLKQYLESRRYHPTEDGAPGEENPRRAPRHRRYRSS
jgi:excisionase family DNA binding protein